MTSTSFSSSEIVALSKLAEVEGQVVKTSSDNLLETYDLEKCVEWCKRHSLEKICLQFPDALLTDSVQIVLYLEKRLGKKIYILGDTSCGSCCIDEVTAQHIDADGIIHFGHACLNPTSRLPVFHVLPKKKIDVEVICKEFEKYFRDRDHKILLFYDVSYAHAIESIYSTLKPIFKSLILSTLNCTSNVDFTDNANGSAVVLGRSYDLDNGYRIQDYEAVFLGPNGKTLSKLAMTIPTRNWHHSEGLEFHEFSVLNSSWLKRRRYLVEKLKDAKVVGIVVATLGIKDYLEAIDMVKKALKAKNKKSYILSIGKLNSAKLANFPEMDAFVVIACPENDVFDSREFFKPMLTVYEVELAFNNSREFSTHYCMDFRQILSGGQNYIEFNASTESDVSLISGGIRNLVDDLPPVDRMDALVTKSQGTVAVGKAGATYLIGRSWQGLEQRLGQDCIRPVEKGRSGLPMGYENEPISRES
ncbi:2-(3-amino-3-carboxypropyl)histidine synthase subunit 2 [Cephus cinctus]|uniref:2-(3-amino-3-carboxypropyl)histidine synthase subunit 2 n=1 Tax=Cephus cinctus TaxID=211228 RepID=A0AAJ7FQ39_CEPCN|nr:2-(3-amino-3-carboxypropyl)histidine synthase subunit 2 [Cephus cinctus]